MTPRAIIIGLLSAAIICGITYFNDCIMHSTMMIGNNMPIAVYGTLVLFLLIWNPLLKLIDKNLSLRAPEFAVILALTLAACVVPGSGLLRTFTASIVRPYALEQTNPGWSDKKVLQMLPPDMLVRDGDKDFNKVVAGFASGSPDSASKMLDFSKIPMKNWGPTLALWVPMIIILWIGLLGLSLVVHRQWSEHEHLPYPIADFAKSILPQQGEAGIPFLKTPLFWIGAGFVIAIHALNYSAVWFPGKITNINLSLSMFQYTKFFPLVSSSWFLFGPRLYFTAVGFAFFLATDVSFSLGISTFMWAIVSGILGLYSIPTGSGTSNEPTILNHLNFGAYAGFLAVILFTGRRYYSDVFKKALGFISKAKSYPEAVWGARLFMACMVALIAFMSVRAHLDWQLSTFFVLLTVLTFLIISRILAETGAFFIQAYFYPVAIIAGFMGYAALGPQAIAIMGLLTVVFLMDPRESFMPFVVNSLKLLDLNNVKIGKVAPFIGIAVILGLGVGLPVCLAFQYTKGANMSDGWAMNSSGSIAFDAAVKTVDKLNSLGPTNLKKSESLSGWERFSMDNLKPDWMYIIAAIAGFALITLFTMGRLRFNKWPIHPIAFLVWNTYPLMAFAPSFLLGWIFKTLVMRFGGGKAYHAVKPLMIGLIAGEAMAGVLIMLISAAHYFITGNPPKGFSILPG
ncbi:MAG: DUF6785 family protein [bacterium]